MKDSSMNRRQFMRACVALSTLTLRTAQGQSADAAPNPDFAKLLSSLPALMDRENVPGLQLALIRGGQLAAFESYGVSNRETGAPVTTDTVFEAASLTKPVFAYLTMKLIEEGRLGLETPLHTIAEPPAAGPPELVHQLTAKMILSHTTGLPNWYRGKSPLELQLRPSQGSLFAYSGMAYVYLQKVVETITAQPLDALLQQRIFTPLSMTSAIMVWRDDYSARLAHGHSKDGKPFRYKMIAANAASSLICNAQDYARFAAALIRPPAASDTFLKSESIEQMLAPQIEAAKEISWGLGLGLQLPKKGPSSFFHWGNNGSIYNSFVVGCPTTGEGIVVMTNSGTGLRLCGEFVPSAVSCDHPALRWNRVVEG